MAGVTNRWIADEIKVPSKIKGKASRRMLKNTVMKSDTAAAAGEDPRAAKPRITAEAADRTIMRGPAVISIF
jgi:hypothetical protein